MTKPRISYQAFIAKYLHVIDLILHRLLIIQRQPQAVFCRKDVLENFANFTWKHLRGSLLKETAIQVFSREICEIFKNKYFEEHL